MTKDEKKHWYQVGFNFAWGAMTAAWIVVVVGIGGSYLAAGLGWTPKDDCDRSTWDRCGLRIMTDHKTGQQYLITTGGGIVLRKSQ